jgi:hypothetical protein
MLYFCLVDKGEEKEKKERETTVREEGFPGPV